MASWNPSVLALIMQRLSFARSLWRLGRKLAFALSQAIGGTQIYLPRGDAIRRASRDLGIWMEYDGTVMGANGSVALSQRYGLSEIYIYRIIARQRGLHRTEHQPELML